MFFFTIRQDVLADILWQYLPKQSVVQGLIKVRQLRSILTEVSHHMHAYTHRCIDSTTSGWIYDDNADVIELINEDLIRDRKIECMMHDA